MAVARIVTNDNTAWSVTETIARQAPTSNDIEETRTLFDDFYIFDNIPTFQTLSQLIKWQMCKFLQVRGTLVTLLLKNLILAAADNTAYKIKGGV